MINLPLGNKLYYAELNNSIYVIRPLTHTKTLKKPKSLFVFIYDKGKLTGKAQNIRFKRLLEEI